MRGLSRVLRVDNRKLTFIAGVVLAISAVLGSFAFTVDRVSAADCDDNAMIMCGFTTASDFISKVRANHTQNNHTDLPAMYNGFGLTTADYDNFAAHAILGEARVDGTIWVNGQQVLTGGITFGRSAAVHSPNATVKTINGVKYYGNVPSITFKAGVKSIPIYVLFDDQGTMKFAVMPACGNPEIGTIKKTGASCTVLNATPADKANTYNFTAKAAAVGNATIKTFVYNFGDGSTKTTTNGDQVVTHTYSTPGNYTASVTVYASVPGNSNLKLPSVALCTKQISIAFYNCVQMVGAILDKEKMSYTFTVTANSGNGAIFTGADFDFGDGKTQSGVKPASATTATVTHTYATSGQYNASAVLHFSLNGASVTAPTCKALVTPETVTPECKPGVPVGSPQCLPPCTPGSSVPPESVECQPPLPNTGAGNTIAIFAVVVIGGFLVYRQLLFRKHKAAFMAAQQGTSPLPLGDPLSSDEPLADTPLASKKRSSFRRKRPF